MFRKLTPVLFLLLTFNASAATRYIVALKHPFRAGKLPILHNDGEAVEHRVRQLDNFNSFAADLTPEEVKDLRQSSDVRYVEKVTECHLLDLDPSSMSKTTSDVSKFNAQQTIPWGVAATRAPEVWDLAKNAEPVNVVVMDTGIDSTHPDIGSNYLGGYNTLAPETAPLDDNGHGTHVAGTIAALNNGIGVVGVAPNAHLWAVKVLDSHGKGDTEGVVTGLNWVMSQARVRGGHWIVSLSLGGPGDDAEREAFQTIFDAGILAVAAAGNTGLAELEYPGGFPTVIAAGAIDQTLTHASFSNTGPNMGISAPGVAVLSTTSVGSVHVADVETDSQTTVTASALRGSPKRDVSSSFVFCNLGRVGDFPPQVAGHIAVIERGCGTGTLDDCNLTFNEKVKNAMTAGATAAVIYNFKDGPENLSAWTLIRLDCQATDCKDYQDDLDYPWILALGVSYEDGRKILGAHAIAASSRDESYKTLSGTSMATPHISGVAALVWSLAPSATARDVRSALFAGATDKGAPGYDMTYGYGILNALASAKAIAPSLFGLPAPPPPTKRRPN